MPKGEERVCSEPLSETTKKFPGPGSYDSDGLRVTPALDYLITNITCP